MNRLTEPFRTDLRQSEDWVIRTDQVNVRPMPKFANSTDGSVRFLCSQKERCCLVDWNSAEQREVRRVRNLPVIHRLWTHRIGTSLGYTKRGRLRDRAELFFLSAEGTVLSAVELNDSINDVLEGEGGWYVSTKTGWLYAFTVSGRTRWTWQCPESIDSFRAIPLFVCSAGNRIVAGSWGVLMVSVLRVPCSGKLSCLTGPRRRYRIKVPDPLVGGARDRVVELLDLTGTGLADSVEIGHLSQTFSSEPAGWFGPERPLNLLCQEEELLADADIEIELCLGSSIWAESVVHVHGYSDTVLAGTSGGRACFFDLEGKFRGDCEVGEGPALAFAVLGTVVAVYCAAVLTLLDGRRSVASVQLPEYYAELVAQGCNVLVWAWERAWLVSSRGDVLWSATFPRRIRAAFADHRSFSILAGPMYPISGEIAGMLSSDNLRNLPWRPHAFCQPDKSRTKTIWQNYPGKLIEKPKPALKTINVGDTVFLRSTDMLVTKKKDCFLEPTAEYRREPSLFNNLRVKRAKDGFHVVVLTKDTWKADALSSTVKDWFPVASIVVEIDPEIDLSMRLKSLEKIAKKAEKKRQR